MNEPTRHQLVREMLGSYALGHLAAAETAEVELHLADCAECRADLAEIEPVVRRLEDVDLTWVDGPPAPPAQLADSLRRRLEEEAGAQAAQVAEARDREADELGRRRRRTRALLVAAAAACLVLGGLVGGVVGRSTAPEPPPIPWEPITMAAAPAAGVTVQDAGLVPHTWGVELRIEATGFADGETFRAAFRTEDGTLVPAGEFIGVGANPMTCNLQSSVLRETVTEVVVTDDRGRTVLTSPL